MSLSGMMEFRSLHFCSIRHDWVREMRSRRTLNKSWLTHTDLEEDGKEKNHIKGTTVTSTSRVACTSANWALMMSNLIFSWTARATLFLSKGSVSQRESVLSYKQLSTLQPGWSTDLLYIWICSSTLGRHSLAKLWPHGQKSPDCPTCTTEIFK